MSELNGGSTKLYSDLPPRIYSSATIPYKMNTYLSSLFGLDGKVALLTCAGGHLVGEMSRTAGHAGIKLVCCDLWLEDALRAGKAVQLVWLNFFGSHHELYTQSDNNRSNS